MTVHREVARAHIASLLEWARLYADTNVEGMTESAFLAQRLAHQLAKVYGIADVRDVVRERPASEAPVAEIREELDGRDRV